MGWLSDIEIGSRFDEKSHHPDRRHKADENYETADIYSNLHGHQRYRPEKIKGETNN